MGDRGMPITIRGAHIKILKKKCFQGYLSYLIRAPGSLAGGLGYIRSSQEEKSAEGFFKKE